MDSVDTSNMSNTLAPNRLQALQFLLWLYVASVVMIFAGLNSALIVSKADAVAAGKWREFSMPVIFWFSTGVLLLSSFTGHFSVVAARKNNLVRMRNLLAATVALGIVFLFSQVVGYQTLVANEVFLVGHNSGQYLYIITGLHALHLFGGLVALVVQLVRALTYRIHADNVLGLQLSIRFWHALDVIWIYLYIFLLTNLV